MKTEYINIDKKNKIPVYLLGDNPKILLMAGVHGNEKTGVKVLEKIVKKFRNDKKYYPVAIIPCVNKSAYGADSRVSPKDKVDLNRIFPVDKIKSTSYEVAKAIQEFADKFSIIIDIHVFTNQHTLMCGVDLNINGGRLNKKIGKIMSQIGLDAICRIDHANEPKKDGSLCAYLQNRNKLAFGVELAPYEVFRKNDSERITGGLVNLIKNSNSVSLKKLECYKRLQVFSKKMGIFVPQKAPGEDINKGDTVGIFTEKNQKVSIIKSPFNGKLISISYKRSLKNGDKMFVIGQKLRA